MVLRFTESEVEEASEISEAALTVRRCVFSSSPTICKVPEQLETLENQQCAQKA